MWGVWGCAKTFMSDSDEEMGAGGPGRDAVDLTDEEMPYIKSIVDGKIKELVSSTKEKHDRAQTRYVQDGTVDWLLWAPCLEFTNKLRSHSSAAEGSADEAAGSSSAKEITLPVEFWDQLTSLVTKLVKERSGIQQKEEELDRVIKHQEGITKAILNRDKLIDDLTKKDILCCICYTKCVEAGFQCRHRVCLECLGTLRIKYFQNCPTCRRPINFDSAVIINYKNIDLPARR